MKKTEKKALDTFTQSVRVQMDKTLNTLDEKALDKAVKLIQKAEQEGNRVHVSGIGKPGHIAGYIASLLSSTGTPMYLKVSNSALPHFPKATAP